MKKLHATPHPLRRAFLLGLVAAGSGALLQGCFAVVGAGTVAGAALAADRRTSGAYVEDETIEWKVLSQLNERFGSTIHVNVTSYNRNVLLTGEAPTAQIQAEIERIAAKVTNVRGTINEVVVGGNSSLSSRSNDTLITSNIKARFLDAHKFAPNHIKVVTEAGVVFLLGIVTRAEGDTAADIARHSKGVVKVVRVFEYISPEEAKRIDNKQQSSPPSAS